MRRVHAVGRALAAGLIVAALSGSVAAAVSYLILNDSPFTDSDPAPAMPRSSRTASPTSAPSPTAPAGAASPQGTASAWPLGSCVTSWQPTTTVGCDRYGVLRIVGTLHGHGRNAPCADVPEATAVRHVDAYTLCLATP